MDPVTTAIVAAAGAGLARGAGTVADSVLPDAYRRLKELLAQKFGASSAVAKAVDGLETRPDSSARREVLGEEVEASGAARDAELLDLARRLLELLANETAGAHVQRAEGSYIAQADRHGHAEVRVNQPPD